MRRRFDWRRRCRQTSAWPRSMDLLGAASVAGRGAHVEGPDGRGHGADRSVRRQAVRVYARLEFGGAEGNSQRRFAGGGARVCVSSFEELGESGTGAGSCACERCGQGELKQSWGPHRPRFARPPLPAGAGRGEDPSREKAGSGRQNRCPSRGPGARRTPSACRILGSNLRARLPKPPPVVSGPRGGLFKVQTGLYGLPTKLVTLWASRVALKRAPLTVIAVLDARLSVADVTHGVMLQGTTPET